MSRGMPSLTALLGLVALAGYQNRDKLSELLKGASAQPGSSGTQSQLGGLLGNIGGMLRGSSAGGLLNGGLGELLDRFKQNGHGDTAQSWINNGPNKQVSPPELKQAIGPDVGFLIDVNTAFDRDTALARGREFRHSVFRYHRRGVAAHSGY